MKLELNKEDIVIIDEPIFPHTLTVQQFMDAVKGEGLDVEGNLYFYIPDFEEKIYKIINNAISNPIWFAFDKIDIPFWSKESSVNIYDRPLANNNLDKENEEEETTEDNDELKEDKDDIEDGNISSNLDVNIARDISSLLESDQVSVDDRGDREAKIYVFGSSKGGTGKTFTGLISARWYAKTHPGEKVAVFDGDIIDPQIAIAIHKVNPTLMGYYKNWINNNKDFGFMEVCKTQNPNFPLNLDFYLAPKDFKINNNNFWRDVLNNLVSNYDVVFIDTGIDYINIPVISYCYKIADRIILVSTTSIKSTSSVLKQINRLKGNIPSPDENGVEVYSKDDNLSDKMVLAITCCEKDDPQNSVIIDSFKKQIKIGAIFGQISSKISKAEFFGQWDIFDNNAKFTSSLERLLY